MPFVNKTMTVLIKKSQLFLNINILFIFVIKWQNAVYVFIYLFIYIYFFYFAYCCPVGEICFCFILFKQRPLINVLNMQKKFI